MKKPSERILEISNALKVISNKEAIQELELYEVKAIAQFLDEWFKKNAVIF